VIAVASRRASPATWLQRSAWLAFAALLVLSPLRARFDLLARPVGTIYGDYTDVLLFWSDIAGLLALGLWLGSLAARPRPVWFGPRFLAWPVAALLVLSWLGTPFAVDPALAALTSLRLTLVVALAVYVCNEVAGPARLAVPVAVMLAVQSVIGIGQVVAQKSLDLSGLGEHLLSPSLGVSVITAANGTRFLRAYGLSDHPNILGGILAVGVLLVGGMAAVRRSGGTSLSLSLVITSLAVAAVLVTFSRSAWLGLFAGAAVLAGMLVAIGDRRALRQLGVVCAAGLLAAAPFVLPFRSALSARTDPAGASATETRSVDERTALAQATTNLLAAHPLLGVGAGGIPEAMRAADPSFRYTYQPASVVLLDVTAETGIAGGAAYLVILVAPWIAMLRRRARWTPELAVVSGALAVLTVVGLLDYYTWTYSAGRIWAWVILGLWAVTYRSATYRSATAQAAHAA
jgi:O-antigen ligase